MKFKSVVWKGNKTGAGFIRFPKDFYDNFELGENTKVTIVLKSKLIAFYPKISNYKNYLGIYIPKNICTRNGLIGKDIEVVIERIKGFHSKLGYDGRLYIPNNFIEIFNVKKNDLVKIEGYIGNVKIKRICKISMRRKNNRNEYFCIFSRNHKNKYGVFIIKEKLKKEEFSNILTFLLKGIDYGVINKKKIVAYYTNKTPLIINSNIELNRSLVYYLGCYFADGIKRGASWGISASTFEQAKFYLKMHKKLLFNSKIHAYISITSAKHVDESKLIKKWQNRCGVVATTIKSRKSKSKSLKINADGSLIIRVYNQSVQRFYNKLLEYCIQKICEEKNKILAIEFILGVLEGDGSPNDRKRGYITISSNKKEVKILEKILRISELDYKSRVAKKVTIRLNALGLLKNMEFIKNKIFMYYPKRRRKFIERFFNSGTVKFILGSQSYAASWIKAWLKNKGFLNSSYKITPKGLKLKKDLLYLKRCVRKM